MFANQILTQQQNTPEQKTIDFNAALNSLLAETELLLGRLTYKTDRKIEWDLSERTEVAHNLLLLTIIFFEQGLVVREVPFAKLETVKCWRDFTEATTEADRMHTANILMWNLEVAYYALHPSEAMPYLLFCMESIEKLRAIPIDFELLHAKLSRLVDLPDDLVAEVNQAC